MSNLWLIHLLVINGVGDRYDYQRANCLGRNRDRSNLIGPIAITGSCVLQLVELGRGLITHRLHLNSTPILNKQPSLVM
ncbi:hypothetical protein ACE1CI_14150, partial [Aerosakkonemataceae cyanobacterium BLCC-F50]